MSIVVGPADAGFFELAPLCDFGFTVEAMVDPAIEGAISSRLRPVTPFRKSYETSIDTYRDYLAAPDCALLVARLNGRFAGFTALRRHWNGLALIEELAVDAMSRRRGVARELLAAAIAWAEAQGLAGLMLETQDNNVAACRLYESSGFELGGVDRLLYAGTSHRDEVALFWYRLFDPVRR